MFCVQGATSYNLLEMSPWCYVVTVQALNYGIIVCEFELQLRYYVHLGQMR